MDTDAPTTTEEEMRREERTIIDMQAAATENREAGIKRGKTGVRKHLKEFQALHTTLADAALAFREHTSISFRECTSVIDTLQALRKQTNACLEFLRSVWAIFPGMTSYFSATNSLYLLDGEKTARLILEMDLFQSLMIRATSEDLSHARQRIDMHVALERRLKDEAKYLGELVSHLEELLTEDSSPPISSRSK
jgi:hypothetical protein